MILTRNCERETYCPSLKNLTEENRGPLSFTGAAPTTKDLTSPHVKIALFLLTDLPTVRCLPCRDRRPVPGSWRFWKPARLLLPGPGSGNLSPGKGKGTAAKTGQAVPWVILLLVPSCCYWRQALATPHTLWRGPGPPPLQDRTRHTRPVLTAVPATGRGPP